jgi:hypothetical protein
MAKGWEWRVFWEALRRFVECTVVSMNIFRGEDGDFGVGEGLKTCGFRE